MALTANTAINFNSSVGYTFDSAFVEFVNTGGQDVCRLKSSVSSGTHTVITPTVDPAAWTGEINSITFGGAEAAVVASDALYFHRFFVSFNGGGVYQTFISGLWQDVTPETEGMTIAELQAVRVFPVLADLIAAGGLLRFKINITREVSNAAAGYINQLTIYCGDEVVTFGDEPDGSDILTPATPGGTETYARGIMPDFPLAADLILPAQLKAAALGYQIATLTAQKTRIRFSRVRWSGRFGPEMEDIYDFLQAHFGNSAFVWTPPGFSASRKWICTQPKIERLGPNADGDIWAVESSFLEVHPQ